MQLLYRKGLSLQSAEQLNKKIYLPLPTLKSYHPTIIQLH